MEGWDVCGQVVRVVDLESLAPYICGIKSRQGLWILSCEESIQPAYRTLVVILRCPLVPEITHKGTPEVSLAGKWPYDL